MAYSEENRLLDLAGQELYTLQAENEQLRAEIERLQGARAVAHELYRRDQHDPGPYRWGAEYGKDLLRDINALAHATGTGALTRDCLQRAYKEISRLQKLAAHGDRADKESG